MPSARENLKSPTIMEEYLVTMQPFSSEPRQSRGGLSAVLPSSNVHLLFLAASLAFPFFIFPSFLNLTSQIFEPCAIKKSSDSLILAFVLFPIACGFLSRLNHGDNGRSRGLYPRSDMQKASLCNPKTPCGCYDGYDLWIVYVVKEIEVPVTPPPGEQAARRKREAKRTYQNTVHKPKDEVDKQPTSPWVPPPPPPPPPPVFRPSDVKNGKKRGGPKTKEFSKEGKESIENFESLLASQPLPSYSRQPSPSPPSVFHTPFASKTDKTKEDISAAPPPAAPRKNRAKPDAVSQSTADSVTIKKTHTPVTMTPKYDESLDDSGSLSPSTPMPPPRPPFKVPSWTFAISGHHVLIKSPNAWRHKSPDTEDDEDSASEMIENASDASSEATSPPFCPSPDVNKRAGKFIPTFQASLNQV